MTTKLAIEWPAYVGEPGWEYCTTTVSFYGDEKKIEFARIKQQLKCNMLGDDIERYCAYSLSEDAVPMWQNIKTKTKIDYITDSKLRQWMRESGMILAVPKSVKGKIVTFSVSRKIGGETALLDEIDNLMKALIKPSNRLKRMCLHVVFSNSSLNNWHDLEEYDRLKSEGRPVVYEFTIENDFLVVFNMRDPHIAFSINCLLVDYKIVDYLECGYSCYAEIKSYKKSKCGVDIIFCVYVMY